MKYSYICAVIIFVLVILVPFTKSQANTYISIVNKYHRDHGYQFQYIKNQINNNSLSRNQTNHNSSFLLNQITNDTALRQQQKILEKLIKLFIDPNEGIKQPSPAARLAKQRPFALVSPKPRFLRCIANCPTTNQYDPVCGSDHLTYHNVFKLQCAIRCGKVVRVNMIGACPLDF